MPFVYQQKISFICLKSASYEYLWLRKRGEISGHLCGFVLCVRKQEININFSVGALSIKK